MKLAKRAKNVINMMSCRKSKLYILSFLILINNYYSIRFRIILKLTRWDKWEDKQFQFMPGFYWTKKIDGYAFPIEYEWSLKRPFKITCKACQRRSKNKDILYVDYYSKFLWENNFEHNEDKSYSFDEAEFLDEAWRDEMNFMAGVDIL